MQPRTQYVNGPEGHVAYQVFGRGSRDIVFVPDHPNNIEIMWEDPSLVRFLRRLSTFSRVLCFDKRGSGVSDPVPLTLLPTLEQWMDDVRTVKDAAGSVRTAPLGLGQGGQMAMLFAATYPERTSALILVDSGARELADDEHAEGERLGACTAPSGTPAQCP